MTRAGWIIFLAAALLLGALALRAQQGQARSVVMYVMRIKPEDEWVRIYHEVEDCANRKGQVESVKWYIMDHAVRGEFGGRSFGFWRIRDDGYRQIIVLRGDTATIRHESLHDVLWMSGLRGEALNHPSRYFGVCASREAE